MACAPCCAQVFQAADHGEHDVGRKGVDPVQQPVDAVAQVALFASRLQMDIAGALLDGVLRAWKTAVSPVNG